MLSEFPTLKSANSSEGIKTPLQNGATTAGQRYDNSQGIGKNSQSAWQGFHKDQQKPIVDLRYVAQPG